MKLRPTALSINANMPYKGYEVDGLFHPVEPIEEFIPLKFYNLTEGYEHEFTLDIDYKLKIVSFSVDLVKDDNDNNSSNRTASTNLYLKSYSVERHRLIENIKFQATDSQEKHLALTQSNVIINPDLKYSVAIEPFDANSVTFFCKVINLLPSIDIYFPDVSFSELPQDES